MDELWRDVPGYEGLYQISIDTKEGKCYSLISEKELSNTPNRKGRLYWNLGGKIYQAARWIALTFPELIENEWFEGAHIDHKDTDVLNNHPSNLRWVTLADNNRNPLTRKHNSQAHKGKHPTEETRKKMSNSQINNFAAKKIVQYSIDGVLVNNYESMAQAERETGISNRCISMCCLGKHKTAGGYVWKYGA